MPSLRQVVVGIAKGSAIVGSIAVVSRAANGLKDRLAAYRKTLALLSEISGTIGQLAEPYSLQQRIVARLPESLGGDGAFVSLLGERGRSARVACIGVPKGSVKGICRVARARFVKDSSGQYLIINNMADDPTFADIASSEKHMRSLVCVPARAKDRLLGIVGLVSYSANSFGPDDADLLLSIANQLAIVVENARLYQVLTERAKEIEVIYEVGRTLISTLNHDEVLRRILNVVQESFGYTRCGILLIDSEKGELYVRAASGHEPAVTEDLRLKVGQQGITGWVASTGKPLNVPDVSRDARYVPGPSPAASELALPLKIGPQVIGVLDVQSDRIGAFGERDLRILSSFADLAAIAIENARLYDRTRQMGAIEERNRLAREIHDVLAQNLTSTIVQLEAADGLLAKRNYTKAGEMLRKAMEQAREGLQEARRSIVGLRATSLEHMSLSQALIAESKSFSQETGINVACEITGDDSTLAPEVTNALYRIFKEALSNIRRHADAGNANILLNVGARQCVLAIQDDGIGFDPGLMARANDLNRHFGLIGMRERARLLGGTMLIESNIGAGTRLVIEVPIKGRTSG